MGFNRDKYIVDGLGRGLTNKKNKNKSLVCRLGRSVATSSVGIP
jgi:hypothetical protein